MGPFGKVSRCLCLNFFESYHKKGICQIISLLHFRALLHRSKREIEASVGDIWAGCQAGIRPDHLIHRHAGIRFAQDAVMHSP